MNNKITITELREFIENYYTKKWYTEQRFGQAFLNTYLPEVNNSELFYEKDNVVALMLIYRDYITV
jgi:hypothetical protein